jgi:hypothetical protein
LETVEAPQDAGEEEGRLEPQRQLQQHQQGEPQPGAERDELDQLGEPVIEAEQEVAMPSPNIPVEVPADRRPVLPQGSASAVIDLTIDDPPSDKGKQKADIKMVDAPEDDMVEAFARWPNFAELALVRLEEELPHWGRSTLEFRDAANPNTGPFFTLDYKDEVQHCEYVEGLCKHSV